MRVKMTMRFVTAFMIAVTLLPASLAPGYAQPITTVNNNDTPDTALEFQHQMQSIQEEVAALPIPDNAGQKSGKTVQNPDNAGQWQNYTATWYDMGTTTFTGTHVTEGRTIAVDPRLIPLGSTVEVKFSDGSTHQYKAEDTGSAIHGHIIDIYLRSEKQCFKNGRQKIQIRIIQKGKV